jgi:hypothetical protein
VLRLGLRSSRAWITFSWAQIKSRRWLISAGDDSEEVMAGDNASAYLSPIPNPLHTSKPCKPRKIQIMHGLHGFRVFRHQEKGLK